MHSKKWSVKADGKVRYFTSEADALRNGIWKSKRHNSVVVYRPGARGILIRWTYGKVMESPDIPYVPR